jgi:hypothetical protein
MLSAYWATVTAFYLGRQIFGPAYKQGYVLYLLSWLPINDLYWLAFLVSIILPALLSVFLMAYFLHRASNARYGLSRFISLAIGVVVGIVLGLSGAGLALVFFGGGGYAFPVIVMAGGASVTLTGASCYFHISVDACSKCYFGGAIRFTECVRHCK